MSVIDGLVFKGERIIIPITLQGKALQAIHRSHMGIQKTLDRSKGCFYWSGISKDITHVCETCEECLKYTNRQQKEPREKLEMSVKLGNHLQLIFLNLKVNITL